MSLPLVVSQFEADMIYRHLFALYCTVMVIPQQKPEEIGVQLLL